LTDWRAVSDRAQKKFALQVQRVTMTRNNRVGIMPEAVTDFGAVPPPFAAPEAENEMSFVKPVSTKNVLVHELKPDIN
jgi:hypothetical protein